MSGPKCTTWEVQENRRRAERARAAALAEARALEERAQRATERIVEAERQHGRPFAELHGTFPAVPSESSRLGDTEAYLSAMRSCCAKLENGLAVRVQTARVLAAIGGSGPPGKTFEEMFKAPKPPSRAADLIPAEASPTESRKTEAARILGRLSAVARGGDIEKIEALAARFIAAPDAHRAEGLGMELRFEVQRANDNAKAALREAERAAALRDRLLGLEGADVAGVSAELAAVERGEAPLTEALAVHAEAVERTARAREDRAYAAAVIREELEALGYVVGDGFSTLFVEGGEVRLEKPALRDYRVLMQLDPAAQQIDARVGRLPGGDERTELEQRLRDREAEQAWCEDFARLLAAAGKRKVAGRVIKRTPAGVRPVEVLDNGPREHRLDDPARRRLAPRERRI